MAKCLENVTRMDKTAAIRNARTMVTSAECKTEWLEEEREKHPERFDIEQKKMYNRSVRTLRKKKAKLVLKIY